MRAPRHGRALVSYRESAVLKNRQKVSISDRPTLTEIPGRARNDKLFISVILNLIQNLGHTNPAISLSTKGWT